VSKPEPEPTAENTTAEALREAAVNGTAELSRKTTRDAFASRLFVIVSIATVIIVVIFGYSTLKAVRDTQHAAIAINRQTRACVTPGTLCFDQAVEADKARTAAIVAAVIGGTNESALYYAYCADRPGHQSLNKIRACAARLLHPR
jgi:hypothetical protein